MVANARALAYMRGQAGQQGSSTGSTGAGGGVGSSGARFVVPASAMKDATPGGELAKEGAGKPWVFSVDAMLADFLGGKSGS